MGATASLIVAAALLAASSPEQQFWLWFRANADAVRTIKTGDEPIADVLSAQLAKVHPDLTWEVGGENPKQREIVISAGGIREAFPAVQRVVAAAPTLSGWKVIAFRPRKSASYTVSVGGHDLRPQDVWFSAESDHGKVGLTLYIRGLTARNDEALAQASFLLLDSLLGEFDVETKLGFIERQPLPANPNSRRLHPIQDLAAVIDSWPAGGR